MKYRALIEKQGHTQVIKLGNCSSVNQACRKAEKRITDYPGYEILDIRADHNRYAVPALHGVN